MRGKDDDILIIDSNIKFARRGKAANDFILYFLMIYTCYGEVKREVQLIKVTYG